MGRFFHSFMCGKRGGASRGLPPLLLDQKPEAAHHPIPARVVPETDDQAPVVEVDVGKEVQVVWFTEYCSARGWGLNGLFF